MSRVALHHGDCLDVLRTLDDASVDAVVTDPPYGLSFMGKRWDYDVPGVDVWSECLRVLKPGGHLLAFAGTRTQHRMAVRIEDAGFEIRDMIAWVYGSGFPKSLDVSKAIDKAAGAEREVVGVKPNSFGRKPGGGDGWGEAIEGGSSSDHVFNITAPATDAARRWHGWGTSLKPALEPITVARKPLIGTVAENVLTHGTGALNVDGCRVACSDVLSVPQSDPHRRGAGAGEFCVSTRDTKAMHDAQRASIARTMELGRWPANLIHDGSEEVVGLFPQQNGVVGARREGGDKSIFAGGGHAQTNKQRIVGGTKDSGSAARFFYCAKASKRDRDEGCESIAFRRSQSTGWSGDSMPLRQDGTERKMPLARNNHPTVKPTDLMRYLCRLVTPPNGVVLDPFMGSGSTGKAAIAEGFRFIGIEREAEYVEIARARIGQPTETLFEVSA